MSQRLQRSPRPFMPPGSFGREIEKKAGKTGPKMLFWFVAGMVILALPASLEAGPESSPHPASETAASDFEASSDAVAVFPEVARLVQTLVQSAEKGDPMLQLNVAAMYQEGTGVPRDFKKAMDLYRRAAEQGLPYAMVNLGLMYATIDPGPPEPVVAYAWLYLATLRYANHRDLPKIQEACDNIGCLLSEEQRASARSMAEAWDRKIPRMPEF